MTYHRQIQGLGSSATLPATIPVIVDGHMGDPPSTNPLVVLGLAAAAAFVLYKVLGSSMSRNPPPGYGITYKDPNYGDAVYAEDCISYFRKHGRMPSSLNAQAFRDGTRQLGHMMSRAKKLKDHPRYADDQPMETQWGDTLISETRAYCRDNRNQNVLVPGASRAYSEAVGESTPELQFTRRLPSPHMPPRPDPAMTVRGRETPTRAENKKPIWDTPSAPPKSWGWDTPSAPSKSRTRYPHEYLDPEAMDAYRRREHYETTDSPKDVEDLRAMLRRIDYAKGRNPMSRNGRSRRSRR